MKISHKMKEFFLYIIYKLVQILTHLYFKIDKGYRLC